MISKVTFGFGAICRPFYISNKLRGGDHFSLHGQINDCTGLELGFGEDSLMLRNATEVRSFAGALDFIAKPSPQLDLRESLVHVERDTAPECADDGYEGCADFKVVLNVEGDAVEVRTSEDSAYSSFDLPLRDVPVLCEALAWLANHWDEVTGRLGREEPLEGLL